MAKPAAKNGTISRAKATVAVGAIVNSPTAGSASKAASIGAQRAAGAVGIDTTGLMGEFIDSNSATQRFRLTARVPLADGAVAIVARSVNLTATVRDGMPWHTYRFEQRLREDTAAP